MAVIEVIHNGVPTTYGTNGDNEEKLTSDIVKREKKKAGVTLIKVNGRVVHRK